MDLAPSEVRRIIIEEHGFLKKLLQEMEALIGTKQYESLRIKLREFNQHFLKHIEKEEKILRPALKDIDAWGAVRVQKMNEEHALQRAQIKDLDQKMMRDDSKVWLPEAREFIDALYRDIQHEESECLSPEVLKDDPITVSTSTG